MEAPALLVIMGLLVVLAAALLVGLDLLVALELRAKDFQAQILLMELLLVAGVVQVVVELVQQV